jgi:AcrR family transcriptional regulator
MQVQDSARPGLRERKKAEVRAALQDATLALALEHGYENVTVEAIVAAVGVSPRTFSNYFSSKEEALLAPDPSVSERLSADIEARPADEAPLTALTAVLVAKAERLVARRDAWQARMALVSANPALAPRVAAQFSGFEAVLAGGVGRRTGLDPASDPYPQLVAAAAAAALRVALAHWRADHGPTLPELVSTLMGCLGAGLPTPTHPTDRTPTDRSDRSRPTPTRRPADLNESHRP